MYVHRYLERNTNLRCMLLGGEFTTEIYIQVCRKLSNSMSALSLMAGYRLLVFANGPESDNLQQVEAAVNWAGKLLVR
jgi:hypothetical protein